MHFFQNRAMIQKAKATGTASPGFTGREHESKFNRQTSQGVRSSISTDDANLACALSGFSFKFIGSMLWCPWDIVPFVGMGGRILRLYAKLATDALTDPKFMAVGNDGWAMYTKGLLFAKLNLTDGFVPFEALPLVGMFVKDPKKLADKMVEVNLWVHAPGGYSVPPGKWQEWQTTREQVEKERSKDAERKANYRKRQKAQLESIGDPQAPAASKSGYNPKTSPAEQHHALFSGLPESHQTDEMRRALADYLTMRKEAQMKPFLPSQLTGQISTLAAQSPPVAVEMVMEAIKQAWRGFYEPKNGKPHVGATNGKHPKPEMTLEENLAELERRRNASK